MSSNQRIIITGNRHGGKTTFTENIVREARSCGFKVGGILTKAFVQEGEYAGYVVEDIQTGLDEVIVTKNKVEDFYDNYGPYYFLKAGVEFAEKCLSQAYLSEADIVVLDEVGAMELEDRMYHKILSELLSSNASIIILVVRDEFIEMVCRKYGIVPSMICRVGENPRTLVASIIRESVCEE